MLKLIVYMFLKPPVAGIEAVGANSSRPLVVIVGIAVTGYYILYIFNATDDILHNFYD